MTNRLRIARRLILEEGTVPDELMTELITCTEEPKSFLDAYLIDGQGFEGKDNMCSEVKTVITGVRILLSCVI